MLARTLHILTAAAMLVASQANAADTTSPATTQVGEVPAPLFVGTTLEQDVDRLMAKAATASTTAPLPETLTARLRSAKQGDTIDMSAWDMQAVRLLPLAQTAGGPPMLFADDPEYIRVPEGAVLRERVHPGTTRMYIYHCNGTDVGPRRITAVMRNLSDEPLTLRMTRRAFPGVSLDYGRLGRTGIRDFLGEQKNLPAPRVIAPGATEVIDDEVEAARVRRDELLHAWIEFETDQPGEVTILQTDPGTPGPVASAAIHELIPPKRTSGAGRGYFPFSEYAVRPAAGFTLDTASGARQMLVADGRIDRWLTGFDSTCTTRPCVLKGNYGVVYRFRIPRAATDGRSLALMVWNVRTVRGCGGMSGCVEVNAGKFPAGLVMVPTDKGVLVGNDKAVLLQVYPPPAAGGDDSVVEFTYSPPGASCLPTPLLLLPFDAGSGD